MKSITINLNKDELTVLKKRRKERPITARELIRINILLLSDSKKQDNDIANFLDIARSTVWRTKLKYLKKGIKFALGERARSGQPRKYNQRHETILVALACSKAPKGRSRWTLRLLSEVMKKQEELKTINRESIRLILKKRM